MEAAHAAIFEPHPPGLRGRAGAVGKIRCRVQWWQADAFIHLPTPPYDFLIACRNLAIYLEHPAAAAVVAAAACVAAAGGAVVRGQGGAADVRFHARGRACSERRHHVIELPERSPLFL